MTTEPRPNILQRRPTETATPVISATAMLIARVLGVDDVDTIMYITIVLSFVPSAVTWVVEQLRTSRG